MAIPSDADPESAAAAMRQRADVEYAQPRYLNHAMARPNDTLYSNQWNFPAIDMERAWDIQPGASSNIIVAVLDSGMAFGRSRSATTRASRIARRRAGPSPAARPGRCAVCGCAGARSERLDALRIAARLHLERRHAARSRRARHARRRHDRPAHEQQRGTAGMAYNVRLMPVKVIQGLWDESSAVRSRAPMTWWHAAFATPRQRRKVINLSIGREDGGPATVVTEAIRYAVSRGCFVVVASATRAQTATSRTGSLRPRREIDGMVAVGAVGRTLDLAFYSTTGPYVELSAPGGDQRARRHVRRHPAANA